MKLINPKLDSTNINLQINFPNSKNRNWTKVEK